MSAIAHNPTGAEQGALTWQPNISVERGETVTYDGTEYEALQSHTTQAGWEPPNVPALWQIVE